MTSFLGENSDFSPHRPTSDTIWSTSRSLDHGPRGRAIALCAILVVGLIASCGEDDGGGPGSPDQGVRVRFELGVTPLPFGAVPFPDDLYLDGEGHITVGELPGEDRVSIPDYLESIRDGLETLDGFGTTSPVFFYLDGAIDPASLPADPAASMAEGASVMMIDVDPASPNAFTRVPILVNFQTEDGQLAMRPAAGEVLVEGRHYAAIVTSALLATAGRSIEPSEPFVAIRDAAARPTDSLAGRAYDQYEPVLSSLAADGLDREAVVAMAVFGVQSITADLIDARALVRARSEVAFGVTETLAAGADLDGRLGTPSEDVYGVDIEGGVKHDNMAFLLNGTYPSPNLVSADPQGHGIFERGADGVLVVKRESQVPYSLFLPRTSELAALPVVIFQHGIGAERSDALAVADALNAAGYAVVAIDAPYHGLRAGFNGRDAVNRFTGAMEPDRFGDGTGGDIVRAFAGIDDSDGPFSAFHPLYMRESLRQAAVDLLALAHTLREGNLDEVRASDPALATLGFSSEPLLFVGNSLGGIIGTLFATVETDVGACALVVTGGHITNLVVESPPFNSGYMPLLLPLLGVDPEGIDYQAYHPSFLPELSLYQILLDKGDSVSFGPMSRSRSLNVLMPMAMDDETLSNEATEALARALGAEMVGQSPRFAALTTTASPVRGNVVVDDEMRVTRAVYPYGRASHGLLTNRYGSQRYGHPVRAPFENVEEMPFVNPNAEAIAQLLHFFESYRAGAAEIAAPISGP